MINAYLNMWRHIFNFSGRTSVADFWWAYLSNFIVRFVLGLIGVEVVSTAYYLVSLVPILSIAVRRLRDAGKGWGWIFINVIPLISQSIFIVVFCYLTFIIMLCKPSVGANVVDAL